jgi:xanthine dehydrogenase accessory factor
MEDMHRHTADTVQDPVCHMTVTVRENTPRSTHRGQAYYFCCQACKEAFDKDPTRYAP